MTQTEMEGFVTYLRLVYVEKKFKFIVVFTIFNPYPISLTSAGGVNNKLRKVRMRHVCCPVSSIHYGYGRLYTFFGTQFELERLCPIATIYSFHKISAK